jgi:hypothetical protein
MSPNRRMYIDFIKIQELLNEMSKLELIDFLNKRMIIPIDDATYDFLLLLQEDNDLVIKKVNKKLN